MLIEYKILMNDMLAIGSENFLFILYNLRLGFRNKHIIYSTSSQLNALLFNIYTCRNTINKWMKNVS